MTSRHYNRVPTGGAPWTCNGIPNSTDGFPQNSPCAGTVPAGKSPLRLRKPPPAVAAGSVAAAAAPVAPASLEAGFGLFLSRSMSMSSMPVGGLDFPECLQFCRFVICFLCVDVV